MEDLKITKRTIDLENIFREKNPTLVKLIPGFVFGYLRKVIHEKDINRILYNHRDLMGLEFVEMLIHEFGAILEVEGIDNIPQAGRNIIAANHPLGGLDGVALMQVVGKKRQDIVFPVNDLLLYLPNLKPLFIPVNKHGSNSENLQIIHETFESDKLMLYFPAGLVSRRQNGQIEDLEWKTTFISKARKYKRDIIPTFIEGSNSGFFYRLANLRKKLKIGANIEMLYLPDEMFKQKNKTIRIIFGKPIPHALIDKRYNFGEWAKKIKHYIYAIGRGETEAFDPKKEY